MINSVEPQLGVCSQLIYDYSFSFLSIFFLMFGVKCAGGQVAIKQPKSREKKIESH